MMKRNLKTMRPKIELECEGYHSKDKDLNPNFAVYTFYVESFICSVQEKIGPGGCCGEEMHPYLDRS